MISAVLGRSTPVLQGLGDDVVLVTSDRAVEEAARRLALGMGRADLLSALARLIAQIEVVPIGQSEAAMGPAALFLRDANQSRNGATSDAHILALAWRADADVWSHDRDFAGTGVASWSTLNLLRAAEFS